MTPARPGRASGLPWILALLALLAFAFQGTRGIWEPDEGRYSAAAVHMQQGGLVRCGCTPSTVGTSQSPPCCMCTAAAL